MIAACPKCQTRYRVEPERIGPDGARLRCTQCSSVFRVRKPEAAGAAAPVAPAPKQEPALEAHAHRAVTSGAPAHRGGPPGEEAHASEIASSDPARSEAKPSEAHQAVPGTSNQPRSAEGRFGGAGNHGPSEEPTFDHQRLVLVAHPNPDACKRLAEALEREGLQVLVAHDGVEAILSIQRALPRAVVLDAALPKMFGFQVCELVKRNESLRAIQVCMMGAIHRDDRYRRAPNELYGADFYLEPPALPGALLAWLARLDLPMRSRSGPAPAPRQEPAREAPAHRDVTAAPPVHREVTSEVEAPAREADKTVGGEADQPLSAEGRFGDASDQGPTAAPVTKPATAPATKPAADPHTAERAQAERLARIIVSDIVLYNEEKFAAAVRGGSLLESLHDELAEGRALFRERIDASVREERDYLADELVRVARSRGMP
jgi:predicted Zn finger-like uncharacterized protein